MQNTTRVFCRSQCLINSKIYHTKSVTSGKSTKQTVLVHCHTYGSVSIAAMSSGSFTLCFCSKSSMFEYESMKQSYDIFTHVSGNRQVCFSFFPLMQI